MKKFLVTGGSGYVGNKLVNALFERGHSVISVDTEWFGQPLKNHDRLQTIKTDIRNYEEIPVEGVETIFHLANIANDPCVDLDPKLSWEVNCLAGMQLLERAKRAKVKRFVFASSGSVYGVKEEPKVTEDLSLVPISEYNKTKMVMERVALSYSQDMLIQIVRPATVCGVSARQRLDLSVNLLTMQALSRGKITVLGGDQTRPNIHVDDLVRVYLHLYDQGEKALGIYNAGFENISILDIAKTISSKLGAEIEIKPSNDPRSYRLDSSKLLATGFKPRKNSSKRHRRACGGFSRRNGER